jgi:hypothetical protein
MVMLAVPIADGSANGDAKYSRRFVPSKTCLGEVDHLSARRDRENFFETEIRGNDLRFRV